MPSLSNSIEVFWHILNSTGHHGIKSNYKIIKKLSSETEPDTWIPKWDGKGRNKVEIQICFPKICYFTIIQRRNRIRIIYY